MSKKMPSSGKQPPAPPAPPKQSERNQSASKQSDSKQPPKPSDSKQPPPKQSDSKQPPKPSDSKQPPPKQSDSKQPPPKQSDSKQPPKQSESKQPPKQSDSKQQSPSTRKSSYQPNIKCDATTLTNLRSAMYKLSLESVPGRVTGMAVIPVEEHIIVGVMEQGAIVYKLLPGGGFQEVVHLAAHPGKNEKKNKVASGSHVKGACVHDITVAKKYLCYIKDEESTSYLCIHMVEKVLAGDAKPCKTLLLNRQAPMVLVEEIDMVVVGGAAWTESWVSNHNIETSSGAAAKSDEAKTSKDKSLAASHERNLRAISIKDLSVVQDWRVTKNGVHLLRQQATSEHNMVAAADIHKGIKVYDMLRPTENAFECLYQVDMEGIRNFQLAGNFLGVFHKFEPNCCFWNMKEQKTILLINIQDQVKELAEQFYDDEEEFVLQDDDHVTAVEAIRADLDYVLLYGTQSGCLFGMSVNSRSQLFQIPCPLELSNEDVSGTNNVTGLGFVTNGKICVTYEKLGITLMDFSIESPPDRPPTRYQRSSSATME